MGKKKRCDAAQGAYAREAPGDRPEGGGGSVGKRKYGRGRFGVGWGLASRKNISHKSYHLQTAMEIALRAFDAKTRFRANVPRGALIDLVENTRAARSAAARHAMLLGV